ncbi:MAG: 50S ribosomal protein L25 [Patescibacteria group bacterium]
MTKINLKSKIREEVGKNLNKFRKNGMIPAIVYGHKIKPRTLWVNYLEFGKVFKEAGESTVIELDIEGKDKVNALIHETQADPITDKFSHIDFFQIRMDEEIETEVPVELFGESPAIKEFGGILVQNVNAIPVKCLPGDLPHEFKLDISEIKTFEDHLKVSDIKIPEKVEILLEADTVVALVTPPRSEEELAALEEKVEEDVTKVEGVADKEIPAEEGAVEEKPSDAKATTDKKTDKKSTDAKA